MRLAAKPTQSHDFPQRIAFKEPRKNKPKATLYVNDTWQGVFDSHELAEMEIHFLQTEGKKVESFYITDNEELRVVD